MAKGLRNSAVGRKRKKQPDSISTRHFIKDYFKQARKIAMSFDDRQWDEYLATVRDGMLMYLDRVEATGRDIAEQRGVVKWKSKAQK